MFLSKEAQKVGQGGVAHIRTHVFSMCGYIRRDTCIYALYMCAYIYIYIYICRVGHVSISAGGRGGSVRPWKAKDAAFKLTHRKSFIGNHLPPRYSPDI